MYYYKLKCLWTTTKRVMRIMSGLACMLLFIFGFGLVDAGEFLAALLFLFTALLVIIYLAATLKTGTYTRDGVRIRRVKK